MEFGITVRWESSDQSWGAGARENERAPEIAENEGFFSHCCRLCDLRFKPYDFCAADKRWSNLSHLPRNQDPFL